MLHCICFCATNDFLIYATHCRILYVMLGYVYAVHCCRCLFAVTWGCLDMLTLTISHVFENNAYSFFVQFWDELAEIAAAHLKRDDRVCIMGSIWVESYLDSNGEQKTMCKVCRHIIGVLPRS